MRVNPDGSAQLIFESDSSSSSDEADVVGEDGDSLGTAKVVGRRRYGVVSFICHAHSRQHVDALLCAGLICGARPKELCQPFQFTLFVPDALLQPLW